MLRIFRFVVIFFVVRSHIRCLRFRNSPAGESKLRLVERNKKKGSLPNEDSQNQNIPEEVKESEQKDRYKYLIFHPPYHPYTVLW